MSLKPSPDEPRVLAEKLQARFDRGKEIGWVYFIRVGSRGLIKIGWSMNPEKRLSTLQVSHAERLRFVGIIPGGPDLERMMHSHFAKARQGGEWFCPNGTIDEMREMIRDFGFLATFAPKSRNSPGLKKAEKLYLVIPKI